MNIFKRLFKTGRSRRHSTNSTQALFIELLEEHCTRLREASPEATEPLGVLPREMIDMVSMFADEKMRLSLTDGQEHSSSISKDKVLYIISTMPFSILRSKEWFGEQYRGYLEYLTKVMNSPLVTGTGVETICHAVFGIAEGSAWVQLTVYPSHPRYAAHRMMITPTDLLTAPERSSVGL